MNEILELIPAPVYKAVFIISSGLFILSWKFGIFKWVKVKIVLPDDFMRHFRWLTPLELQLNLIATCVLGYFTYLLWNIIQKLQITVNTLIK